MDLNAAIQKHAEWKSKFRNAISKKEQMDVASIQKDNCCDLGKWLHGEAKAQYSKLASHGECVTKHAAFHREAAKVAETINKGSYAAAEALMDAGTAYTKASSEVGVAIMHLKKEANL